MISRMSATNNVVDLGETNAQRLTAIEARVRPTSCPTTRTAAAPSRDVSPKTIAARAGQPIIHTMSEAPHGDMTRLEVGEVA
jgi:hypothetical protein